MSQQEWDTGDMIRASHWDLYKGDGTPEDRLPFLLSALGTPRGASYARTAADLRRWWESTASIPAPVTLKAQVERFLSEHSG